MNVVEAIWLYSIATHVLVVSCKLASRELSQGSGMIFPGM